jgi:hypothetical protein
MAVAGKQFGNFNFMKTLGIWKKIYPKGILSTDILIKENFQKPKIST